VSEFPSQLRAALERALEGVPRKGLAERARATSEAYRAGQPSAGVIRSAEDALAYALTRMPATYAACAAVFERAQEMAPGFAPKRLLDAGVGTGGASWAALQAWPGVAQVTWLDSSLPLLALAGRLAEGGPAALAQAEVRRGDLSAIGDARCDLMVASYVLAEVPGERQAGVVEGLWAATEGVLALVEPGTPAGYSRILEARAGLIAAGAVILAPCPHHAPCPLTPPDWCHFSIRLARSRDHRLAKDAVVPFEDERFSYLLAARPEVAMAAQAPRILAPPRTGKPGIELKLCTPEGLLAQRFVGRRDKPAHAQARRLGWGDRFEG
jgi:ribosomal protein RSM22 (predicted rRNA methylase)